MSINQNFIHKIFQFNKFHTTHSGIKECWKNVKILKWLKKGLSIMNEGLWRVFARGSIREIDECFSTAEVWCVDKVIVGKIDWVCYH